MCLFITKIKSFCKERQGNLHNLMLLICEYNIFSSILRIRNWLFFIFECFLLYCDYFRSFRKSVESKYVIVFRIVIVCKIV